MKYIKKELKVLEHTAALALMDAESPQDCDVVFAG
jgi:hypothetical protein